MLDAHIRHLLDTVFKAPPGTAEPDVAALRKAAEEAPKLLGGVPETLASVSDADLVDAAKVWAHQTVSDWKAIFRVMGNGASTAS